MGTRVATSQYIGQCDLLRRKSASNEQKWHAMMGCAEPVSFKTFLAHVDMTPMLDEDDTSSNWITEHRRSDPSTQAYRSWWGTERCWFIQTAGYEFIFLDATGAMLGSRDLNRSRVYHVTSAKVVPAIRKGGFMPTQGDGGMGVYFWDELAYAKRYAAEGGNWSTLQRPVILAVEVASSHLRSIDPDPSMVAEVDPDDEEDLLDRYEHTLVLHTTMRVRLPFKVIYQGDDLGSADDDDDDDDPYADDDEEAPTPAELAATLNRIIGVVHFLRNNANGWEQEGDRVEARRYRKHADKIDAAFAAHDATSLGKLVSFAGITKALDMRPEDPNSYLTANELDRLGWGWARR